jgi:hypothetical protein
LHEALASGSRKLRTSVLLQNSQAPFKAGWDGEDMNLKTVIESLIHFFAREEIAFAVIGAFALKAYGYVRATQDVDFLVRGKDQEKIVRFLETLGYETLYRSKGFSNHLHQLAALGRIDFVYVAGETADLIFAGTRPLLILEDLTLPVVRPEHLIALKIYAMKNDPRRTFREMADIQQILRLAGIDEDEVRSYFEKFGQLEKFDELAENK